MRQEQAPRGSRSARSAPRLRAPNGSRPAGSAPHRREPSLRVRRRRRLLVLAVVAVAVASYLLFSGGGPGRTILGRITGTADAGTAVDPAVFASGACVSFPPTAGDRHLTVFLDAGHGGPDPGAVGTTTSGRTIYEADETLPVELDAMALLRRHGFTVVVSRTGDTSVIKLTPADVSGGEFTVQGSHDDVAARALCADKAHADLLVGIYFDAGSSPLDAGSVTGYDAVRSFAADNLRFARLLQSDVLSAMNAEGWEIPDEGVIQDSQLGSSLTQASINYGHLLLLGPADPGWFDTPSEMPGALIEPLFITDPFEGSIAASAKGQQVIAGGTARAVEQYFGPPSGRKG
ncbi:MAG TPA: N-acetylmuramoyl-L-alanine amidase [Acidimicrobiales bacterium]|nr:N-acetylmuramoyl-L-alanine amidase [Acidimicrobiales bacterium]